MEPVDLGEESVQLVGVSGVGGLVETPHTQACIGWSHLRCSLTPGSSIDGQARCQFGELCQGRPEFLDDLGGE